MRFSELEKRLRVFETAHDHNVLPGIYMVARLDGRSFTRLTKETHRFEAPFDIRFRDLMVETVKHLMDCGFRIVFGYTQSDEISLLFHPAEETFSRKLRKYNSILAGEASAGFSLLLGSLACFDCRLAQLPAVADVVDYFRWRSEDAHRNALNGHCYWALRQRGLSVQEATDRLVGLSVPDKNELLFQHGINFNDLPNWQKRGTGICWEEYSKVGWNPLTQTEVTAIRRRLKVDTDLPMRDGFSEYIRGIIETILHPRLDQQPQWPI
jgi:tRNA(His) 5'-end guanylyltransferase